MTEVDTWGRDPQVRYMRGVFSRIETEQDELLKKLSIEGHDIRLRRFRETALKLFEKAWVMAMQRGIAENEGDAADTYLFCLVRALSMRGIDVPGDMLPKNAVIAEFLKEVLK